MNYVSNFEAFFYPPFLETLSGEFHPPQNPGVVCTLRQIVLNAVQCRVVNPDREPDAYGDMILTYTHSLPWATGIECGVDGRIAGDLPRIDIVFLYDHLAPQGDINELIVSVDEPRGIAELDGTEYQLAPAGSLLAARTAIASAAQRFFDRASREQDGA